MKKSIKILVLLLAMLMVVGMFMACTPAADEPAADEPAADEPAADEPAADEPAADEKLVFAWSPATLDNPYFITVTKGFEDR
ncbi:MAG: hypothetical protein HN389_12820, partial [Clostridia bacterium]|nr:hypothetical protein [Clostridia bacterium]